MAWHGPSQSWLQNLAPKESFPAGPRYGAFLRIIPPCNRVGDYVHCLCRVMNVIMKRLFTEFPTGKAGELRLLLAHICESAKAQRFVGMYKKFMLYGPDGAYAHSCPNGDGGSC